MDSGQGGDLSIWEAAIDMYHQDRVVEAWDLISQLGIGDSGEYVRWYRVIEAEAVSRKGSQTLKLASWLTFEFVPREVLSLQKSLSKRALAACNRIAVRLAWSHGPPTRISILAEEADAPWAVFPYGYCVSKEPYEKICLPSYLADDPADFNRAVAHEYAHVIVSELSGGHAPRWLEESVAVLAEEDPSPADTGTILEHWKDPDQLELALESRQIEDSPEDEVWYAYQQCGWIGRYLSNSGKDRGIRELLCAHQDEGMWTNLSLRLRGLDRVEGALRQTYRISVDQLFDAAKEYVASA